MFQSIFTTGSTTTLGEIICLLASVIYGMIISITYMKTGEYSKNFARTLIVLPIIVSVVMTLVNGNLGTSVAIMGAFSLIRFRSIQGNSRDIAYVFFAMAVGLATGTGYLIFGIIFTLFVCLVLIVLYVTNFGENSSEDKELKITIPENLDYSELFDDIFKEYTSKHNLERVKTTNMGSMYELNYRINLKKDRGEKSMIDEIRCRNGNLTVICGRLVAESIL